VDLDRLGSACAQLDADILGLQEVDVGAGRSQRADLADVVARATGLHAEFAAATTMPDGGLYGNALLTRAPATDVGVVRLPTPPMDEPRIALVATVAAVAVAVTHLSVRAGLHRRQLAALVERSQPTLLLGDLNHERPELPGFTLVDGAPTFPAHDPRVRIDHIAVRGALRVETAEVVRLPVSDHRAVVATVSSPR
jgi:endonuclease/exonuclease/phosphatase family metal-dependent hydrolase